MKVLFVMILWAVPMLGAAQIYRCDTPEGVVFSDRECGEEAEVVELTEETAGISVGPSEEVRERLEEQKQERAEARAALAEQRANQPAPAPAPIIIERPGYPAFAPGFWGNRPPALRPPPPLRPIPPVAPPVRPDVVRPR